MENEVQKLLRRLDEVEKQLGDPQVVADRKRYKELSQEHARLSDVKQVSEEIAHCKTEIEEHLAFLAEESDEAFAAELERFQESLPKLQQKLDHLLIPPDPNDNRDTIVELRAGTGGDEAALFVGDCVRMYKLFADQMGWSCEPLSSTPSDMGGFKEYVMALSGANVYRLMQYEAGTHRVQRVPETETQGRVHTSAITVAILFEPGEEDEMDINEQDLRIDTYRSSGAGGQHVNTTDSAVRITHIPTGVVVYCQDERSQHKNKAHAMRHLKAKLAEMERIKKANERASTRAEQVGSGDRSERIRTYNFPQNRITDHRINYTKHNLDGVMGGELDDLTTHLIAHFKQKKLDAL